MDSVQSIKKNILGLLLFLSLIGRGQLIKEFNSCAIECIDKKDFKCAIEYFTRVIEINPKDSIAYFDRAMMKEYLHDYKGAIEDYTKEIEVDSTNIDNYFCRGIAYYHFKNYNQAITDLNRMLSKEDDNADAFYYRALALMELNFFHKALLDLNKAIELNKTVANYYIKRGEVKIKLKQKQSACNDFSIFKKMGGENAEDILKMHCN